MASCRVIAALCLAVAVLAVDPASETVVKTLEEPINKHDSVSFSFSPRVQKLADEAASGDNDLMKMGQLLAGLRSDDDASGDAVESLASALQTHALMDTLRPDSSGSFVKTIDEKTLGETTEKSSHFATLMHAKKKNMGAITQYLMQRKAEGRPLSAAEDQQLQKFYYNRASTILKKIVLLKKGEEAPRFGEHSEEEHEKHEKLVHPEIDPSAVGADETDKLKYDAAIANDNTEFDNQAAAKLEQEQEANDAERTAENREEMDQLAFDRKVAQANEKYNDQLLTQVKAEAKRAERVSQVAQKAARALRAGLRKENRMSQVEQELEKQKMQAQKAVAQFTSEQKQAEDKVQQAELAKEKADKEAEEAAAMLQAAEAAVRLPQHEGAHHAVAHIPAAQRLSNMVEYLRTALTHHNRISKRDVKIMQNFFLQHGGQLLSKIAKIEPDATWNDKHVMGTEQWAMDRARPDQLSQEWGGRKVKPDTIVRDVVSHELSNTKSARKLQRPGKHQQVQGLFGMAAKLPLKFATDSSAKMQKEPELGEGMSDEEEQHPNEYAYASLMGIN